MKKVYEKPLLNNLILVQSKSSSILTKDWFFLVLEKSSFLILTWKMWLYSLPSCRRVKERTWIGLFGFNRSDFLLCPFFSHFDIFLGSTGRCFLSCLFIFLHISQFLFNCWPFWVPQVIISFLSHLYMYPVVVGPGQNLPFDCTPDGSN